MNREPVSKTAPLSVRAYARHRKALGLDGGSDTAVWKAIRDRRVVKGVAADGKIIAEIADAEWERNTAPRPLGPARGRPQERPRPRARSRIAHSASSGQAAPSTGGPTRQVASSVASSPPPSFGGSNYQLDRARRENVKLRKEVIELRKLEEKFINADEAKVAHFNESRMLRDRAFNIRDRAAPLLAAETDQKKCWEILDSELRLAFGEYADGKLDEESQPVADSREPSEVREHANAD